MGTQASSRPFVCDNGSTGLQRALDQLGKTCAKLPGPKSGQVVVFLARGVVGE